MKQIIAAAIDHKRVVITTLVLIILMGAFGYAAIPKEDNPDVQFPFFSVRLSHDGISPEDAERLLLKPLEKHLKGLDGLKEMRSEGYEGGGFINLEYQPDVDSDQALLDIREAVDLGQPDLPDETDEPVVDEYSAGSQPILGIVMYGEVSQRLLVRLARDLQDRLEGLTPVLEVQLIGDREEVLEVIVDPTKLEVYNVSLSELLNAVQNNNRLVAAGAVDTGQGRFAVKVPGLIEEASDVADLPIKTSRDGVVTLSDLATANRTFKDATSLSRYNGSPALTLYVIKRVGTNTVETAAMARYLLGEVEKVWPDGVEADVIFDNSVYVIDFLGTLRNSVLSAVVLVSIVVVAALGLRSAGLVGVSIPGSFLFGILVLYVMGFSINTVVLFGLILAVGLLVDGAIVVSEYADRKMLEGLERADAYRAAAQRMVWPIIASTMTTLAAFLPLLFWPGTIGEFMRYLPLTLMFVLTGSLLMALIFLPTLGAWLGKPGEADSNVMEHLAASHRFDVMQLEGMTGWYSRLLHRLVRHPWKVAGLTLAALVGVWGLFASDFKGLILFPEGLPNSAEVLVHARGNLSINEKEALVNQVESRIRDINGVRALSTRIGAGSGSSEDTIGSIRLIYEEWHKRRGAEEIERDVRSRMVGVPGVRVEFAKEQQGPVRGKDIQLNVSSPFPRLIEPVVQQIRDKLEDTPGLVDIEDSRPVSGIEWKLEVDRAEAGRYGTDIVTVGSFIQLVTNGALVGKYRPDDAEDEVDIRVRFPADSRGITALDTLRVPTQFGMVPVTNFVDRRAEPNAGTIERIDSNRVMTVQANTGPDTLPADVVAELRTWLAQQGIDPRVMIEFAGQDEVQQESTVFLARAFMVALFLMGIILLTQFNSFYHTFLILMAVLLSTIGVAFGLWATQRPFVLVMTGVGIISLAGIVVNNNIVLIDTYARLVKQGIEPYEAIIRTGAQRLRPVLLTTITTVTGLLPMVFQFNVDFLAREVTLGSPTSDIWVDLALAITFGLSFATFLTLLVTPSMLALRLQTRDQLRRWRGKHVSTPPVFREQPDAPDHVAEGQRKLPDAAE